MQGEPAHLLGFVGGIRAHRVQNFPAAFFAQLICCSSRRSPFAGPECLRMDENGPFVCVCSGQNPSDFGVGSNAQRVKRGELEYLEDSLGAGGRESLSGGRQSLGVARQNKSKQVQEQDQVSLCSGGCRRCWAPGPGATTKPPMAQHRAPQARGQMRKGCHGGAVSQAARWTHCPGAGGMAVLGLPTQRSKSSPGTPLAVAERHRHSAFDLLINECGSAPWVSGQTEPPGVCAKPQQARGRLWHHGQPDPCPPPCFGSVREQSRPKSPHRDNEPSMDAVPTRAPFPLPSPAGVI